MPDSFTVGEAVAPICGHRPGSVSHSQERNGYVIRCGLCREPLALIPGEWPIAQTMAMWQDDAQRWDYLREADAIQRRGEQCVCGRAPTGVQQVNGSRCGQCNPNAMRLNAPPQEYGTSPGAEALAAIQEQMIVRAVDRLTNPPMTASEIVNRAAENSRTTARLNAEAANQRDIYTAAQTQNAYRSADVAKPFSRAAHEIEDVRGRVVSDIAFMCKCGWGVSRVFAKAVFETHGERELIKLLETHIAGGAVGPVFRPKMTWAKPNFVELLQHRPFWKSPICRQIWQTPVMSEPAFTPRRRIILEE